MKSSNLSPWQGSPAIPPSRAAETVDTLGGGEQLEAQPESPAEEEGDVAVEEAVPVAPEVPTDVEEPTPALEARPEGKDRILSIPKKSR